MHRRLDVDIFKDKDKELSTYQKKKKKKDKELSIKHMLFQLLHVKKTMIINMKAKKKDYLILNDIF